MKFDPMWTTTKSLANVKNVILRKFYTELAWSRGTTFTGNRLLYGTYVLLKNMELDLKKAKKGNEDWAKAYRIQAEQFQTQIKELTEYKHLFYHAGWRATVTCYHWSCGDGCCSDSHYGFTVYNKEGMQMFESDYKWNSADSCTREIHEKYGKHVQVDYDDNYDDATHDEEDGDDTI